MLEAPSRPLDVHRWSDHPESNRFVNQIYDEWFAQDAPNITKKHLKVILLDIYVGWKTHPDTTIGILVKEQNVPNGFTVLSAAKGDQTSQSLEEAKHGLFSYFLMRGPEGDADTNNDNQITAGELHSFVTDKVERQSGFKQTPDLQGDAERVLVRFQ
jgi:hypothetical protein